MTKEIFTSFVLIRRICFFLVSFSFGLFANIEVCPDCRISSIKDAADAAKPGDTIFVSKGNYQTDNIHITKRIVLVGKDYPTILSREGDEIFSVTADSVVISGFILKGVTTSYLKERSAIRMIRCKGFAIMDNLIEDCFFGIYLEHARSGNILKNRIFGIPKEEAASGNAIHAWYCEDLTIKSNDLRGHRDGIYFEFVNNSIVLQNHSEGNSRYGLHFMFSNDDQYRENTFTKNGVGVAVMFSRRIIMADNNFEYNWGRTSYGLLLKEIFDAEILRNSFTENTVGIFVEGSNRINYFNNTFKQNGWAIKFSGGCETNQVMHNNFLNNSLDVVMNSELNDNVFRENYWSNYSGYDLDKDNVGDIPYYPVKLYSYILDNTPEAIVLMRSFFIDLINFSEKISPVFTPKQVFDDRPLMEKL